jgi:hypothetical protein
MHYLYLYFLPYCIGYDFLQSSHGFFEVQFRLDILPKLEYYPNLTETVLMANEDISGEFRRRNEPLSYYWRMVRSAMASDISVSETLRGGFWPSSIFGLDLEDEFMDDGTVHEEYAEDAPFVGRRRDRPAPSFCVG